jgi:adenylate kinase family enzyme
MSQIIESLTRPGVQLTMQKVAVFGNAGGGKSTLSKQLSEITGLPLYVLDKLQYQPGGAEVSHEEYLRSHQLILEQDRWIIDGFGSIDTFWVRLAAADTLVFVDLPLYIHSWWVTKRFLMSAIHPPEGYPKSSPILKSALRSYRVLWLCHQHLTPKYREFIDQERNTKRVYHLRSPKQIQQFLDEQTLEQGGNYARNVD